MCKPTTPERLRVLEAAINLVDCDDEDDRAYHAAWERLRFAARDWLGVWAPPRVARAKKVSADQLSFAECGSEQR